MKIQKRDGQLQEFEGEKIAQAIRKAFSSTGTLIEESVLKEIIEDITKAAAADKPMLSVGKTIYHILCRCPLNYITCCFFIVILILERITFRICDKIGRAHV